jgi:hypothetical protein
MIKLKADPEDKDLISLGEIIRILGTNYRVMISQKEQAILLKGF